MMNDLQAALTDPYSIEDTSNGDPRIHAVRRIALAAQALGKAPQTVAQDALFLLNYPMRKGIPVSVQDLTARQLEKVADAYEQALDAQVYV